MRWSLSTKVFLGFAAIIFAFGSVGLFGIYRMNTLRRNVQLIRKGVLPLRADLRALLHDLNQLELQLHREEQWDLIRLTTYLSGFKPFEGLRDLEERIDGIVNGFRLDEPEREFLVNLRAQVHELRRGTGMRNVLESATLPEGLPGAPASLTPREAELRRVLEDAPEARANEDLYAALARTFVAHLHAERFDAAAVLQQQLVGMVRPLRTEVAALRREAGRFITQVDRVAESTEAQSQLVVGVAAGGALLVALLVMIWVGFTLRPLGRLREGARQVARGDFTAVPISTTDEIGQLAQEFNRMAASLSERDRLLAQQREELLRSERLATIGKMSSQITHEIRNPLSSIGLNTELLEDELGDIVSADAAPIEECRQLAAAIRGEVDRLTAVTEQYLRFARLPKPNLAEADINALIGELLLFMRTELTRQKVAVTTDLDTDVGALPVDRNQIRQCVLNLVRNSIESMTRGGDLHLATELLSDRGVRITIRDSGPGIPAETLPQIFEPFFSTKETGTGLGLALVQQIIAEHGGTVICQSRVGEGTEFKIELPLLELGV